MTFKWRLFWAAVKSAVQRFLAALASRKADADAGAQAQRDAQAIADNEAKKIADDIYAEWTRLTPEERRRRLDGL